MLIFFKVQKGRFFSLAINIKLRNTEDVNRYNSATLIQSHEM